MLEVVAPVDVEALPLVEPELSATEKLFLLANSRGDFSGAVTLERLAKIGAQAVEDYEKDKTDRREWEEVVKEALSLAAQSHKDEKKDTPWKGASNVRWPLLTTAALQFNARMYPAVVKGDEAILCKVIGQDNGKPQMMPHPETGQPIPAPQMAPNPETGQNELVMDANGQPVPVWRVPPGAKAKRARRVSEYLNTVLFYRMEDWESDTDTLLIVKPIVGCVFRKLWHDRQSGQPRASMVSALRIFVPIGAKSCDTTPRLTEEVPDVYPHEILEHMRSGFYRDIILSNDPEDDKARLLLEQHRLMDLDGDGLPEPYIVTVDHETQRVLRIEANFGPEDVKLGEDGRVLSIRRGKFYIKYDFFPHPEGKFYGIGLGHLLKQFGDVVDTAINQIMDTGTAAAAGGGFIASGVRLQARGGGSVVRFSPGEYKTVDGISGPDLRAAIVERTLPQVSSVTFQVLDLILGAAKEVAGIKDVITGEASNTGQVGTTLALIEQGLQVFNATAKRTFRALREEYTLLKENIRRYGGEAAADDYLEVLDDPEADFEADFNSSDMDIRPVSDPSSVTRMQKMARGQFLLGTMEPLARVGGDPREALKRVYEAADIEDIDKLLPPPAPQAPNPKDEAQAAALKARALKDAAGAAKTEAETGRIMAEREETRFRVEKDAAALGMDLGAVA